MTRPGGGSAGSRVFEALLLARPAARFLLGGSSRGDVVARALRLRERLLREGAVDEPVCLASEDRLTVAAALLASLAGGPPVVIPHDGTREALRAACEAVPFGRAVGDDPSVLPAGVRLVPLPARGARGPFRLLRALDEPFLHLHTGGSTGHPRSWTKTPRNLLAEARFHAGRYGLGAPDGIVATVSPRHIYGLLFSIVVPLVSGAAVLRESPFFPAAIGRALAHRRATVLVTVPAHVHALARTAWHARLRLALSSTGPLEEADAARFAARAEIAVEELYGSTETGGVAVRCRAGGRDAWQALAGVRWTIVHGRLRVASPYLSPELPRDGRGFFATADRAARAGTRFALLGRADGIAKVGGRRVDVGEIEERIRSLPGVRDAWVWSRAGRGARGDEIVALVTGTAEPRAIRSMLRGSLPPAAWPRRVRRVARLPRTAAGKRDRMAAEMLLDRGGTR
ncbi:MAG: AMP-binding protein [Deltaproteobacteria bacterium]|nr:AMP-binding protein [Deltaproteobacteria bacterium]